MALTTEITPVFTRPEVAALLQCAPLTIANREKSGVYPKPYKDHKGHRVYQVSDIFELMYITYKNVYLKPIVAVMHDKGYTEITDLEQYLTKEYSSFQERITATKLEADEQPAIND
jgi:DNA-binding transcriptional MerR regulator